MKDDIPEAWREAARKTMPRRAEMVAKSTRSTLTNIAHTGTRLAPVPIAAINPDLGGNL